MGGLVSLVGEDHLAVVAVQDPSLAHRGRNVLDRTRYREHVVGLFLRLGRGVEPQPGEGEGHPDQILRGHRGLKPQNGGHNDEDPLQQGADRVGHRGDEGEEGEGKDVLPKVGDAIGHKEEHDIRGDGFRGFKHQEEPLLIGPQGDHGHKGKKRRVIEEVQLVHLAVLEELFRKDVLGHKDHGGGQGGQESEHVEGDLRGAGQDDPN